MPDGEWEPEPASLRDGETRDDTHSSRNAEQLRIADRVLGDEHPDCIVCATPVERDDPPLQDGEPVHPECLGQLRCDGGTDTGDTERLFDEQDRETFREAIETWGLDAQVDMAVEECGEVIVALQHLQRERADRAEVIEELADLRIMFEQLRWYFGADFVDPVVEDKMDRLRGRLDRSLQPETDRGEMRPTDGVLLLIIALVVLATLTALYGGLM